MRPATLRDARKVNAVPSVTTVLDILAKHQLVRWQIKQAVMATRRVAYNPDEAAWIEAVITESERQVEEAAAEGTRIHDASEQYIKGNEFLALYKPHVEAIHAELARIFPGVDDWVAERSFAHRLGYGGKVDLHSPRHGHVVDLKGKDGDFSDEKKLAYDQNWQLAPYQKGLGLPLRTCANIFVSRTHHGCVRSHVWGEDDIQRGLDIFTSTLQVWKHIHKYYPVLEGGVLCA